MRLTYLTVAAALLFTNIEESLASTSRTRAETEFQVARLVSEIKRRSNPTGSYTPSFAACPPITNSANNGSNAGFVRDTRQFAISSNESDYVTRHRTAVQTAWQTWLSSSNPGPGLDGADGIPGGVANYTSTLSNLPKVGIAVSGGGYRAMLHGSGYLMGLDSRNTTAQSRGTAGFLQLADYAAGLSGGSWAIGSLALNDWPTAQSLADNTWNLDNNLVLPSDGTISFYADLVSDVAGKRDEGFTTGIVDYWGRALSYHLVNSTYPNEGQGTTFSDIRNTSNFEAASFPFPIVIADEREPGQLLINRNTTVFEFNPYEFGSWDPVVSGFIPIDILGTPMNNGVTNETDSRCTYGFENFGFVVGTSSTLFNEAFSDLITTDGDSIIKAAVQSILGDISKDSNDVSILPNPFYGYRATDASVLVSKLANITLVDGGEDDQNIPINTLLYPGRALDLILAIDSSADITDWPNATGLHEVFLRYQEGTQYNGTPIPDIPSINTIVNRGLNTRPTFFGCNSTVNITNAATAHDGVKAPIIAYIANYPWSSLSNTSTFQLSYTAAEAQQVLDNAVNVATMGGVTNGSIYWPTCLACASLQRSFERTNTARPSVCNDCFDAYCWDGVTNETTPNTYSPAVGTPVWVTSQGQVQAIPASTGGNGSNAAEGDASGSSSATSGAALLTSSSYAAVYLAGLVALSISCLLTYM
ncbi:hypothetical protein CBS101457_004492 [Exobasidium rhododendri]|nr:hypothetical protein CBS101457_004492 [Exobasidium rhododendri]